MIHAAIILSKTDLIVLFKEHIAQLSDGIGVDRRGAGRLRLRVAVTLGHHFGVLDRVSIHTRRVRHHRRRLKNGKILTAPQNVSQPPQILPPQNNYFGASKCITTAANIAAAKELFQRLKMYHYRRKSCHRKIIL